MALIFAIGVNKGLMLMGPVSIETFFEKKKEKLALVFSMF